MALPNLLEKYKIASTTPKTSSGMPDLLAKYANIKPVNPKIAQYKADAVVAEEEARKANSLGGILKSTVTGLPKAGGETLLNIGKGSMRGFGAAGAKIAGGEPSPLIGINTGFTPDINANFTPQGQFQKDLYGTDQPIDFTSVGKEVTGKDIPVVNPLLGAFFGLADAVPGGSGAKRGVKGAIEAADELANLRSGLVKSKIPLTGKETPQELLRLAEANAAAKHTKPKIQISDEGIPMARSTKSVPFMPKPKSELPPLDTQMPKPKIPKVEETAVPTGILGNVKRDLAPLKYVDEDTANTFRRWNADNIKSKELANQTARGTKIQGDSMGLIDAYQAGENIPQKGQIKKIFDDLFNEAQKAGIDVPYRQNYVPQVYKGNFSDIQKSIAKYLKDNGITDEMAQAYIKGAEDLPIDVANRLKLTPSFNKERVFENYKVAREYGLEPKYSKVSDLAAHYKSELEKVKANNQLIEDLKNKGQIRPADSPSAPKTWVVLNKEFSNKLYVAPPNVAKIINNMFPVEGAGGAFGKIVEKVGEASGLAQNVALSAGLPGTNINFFALGQLNKEIHGANLKAFKSFLKTNNKAATVRFFDEHKQTLLNMADEGIDVTSRQGSFGKETFRELVKDKQILKTIGFGVDKVFGEKTFQGFMPMMQVQLFDDVFKEAIKKGLPMDEAKKIAGDTIKKNFGLNTDAFARSQVTKDTLKAVFFAPRFRETIINSLTNTGKAGVDFIKQLGGLRGKLDPSLSRNRRLLGGMILSYGLYNVMNKQLNGTYMWENPDNRKFALRVPLSNGDSMYVEFMPSFLAFARNMIGGGLAIGTGDFKTATQKFGSLFSMPIKLTTEVIGNSDYFGNPIYKDTDSGTTKTAKIAAHLGLGVAHPFVKEVVNQVQDKKPMYQSIVAGLELPLKFSTQDKEEANKIFKMMDEQKQERADLTSLGEKEFARLKALPKDEANAQLREIKQTDPDLYEKIKDQLVADKIGLTDNERYIKMLGIEYRAKYIFDKASEMETREEKNTYLAELRKKKILTKDTEKELAKLIKQ